MAYLSSKSKTAKLVEYAALLYFSCTADSSETIYYKDAISFVEKLNKYQFLTKEKNSI